MTKLNQEDVSAMVAECESMMDSLLLSFEKVEEVINRSERDGICSEEVAEAAREEIESRREELNFLCLKMVLLHRKFRTAEITGLLTREQLLLKHNQLGYLLTARYFNKISGRSGGYAGPPIAEWWGERAFYRLDDAIAWAEACCSSAPEKLATQIPSRVVA